MRHSGLRINKSSFDVLVVSCCHQQTSYKDRGKMPQEGFRYLSGASSVNIFFISAANSLRTSVKQERPSAVSL